jgi:hypothetical protein
MKLTAQVGAVNHGKPGKLTFPFLLTEGAVVALLARNWAAMSHPDFYSARGR